MTGLPVSYPESVRLQEQRRERTENNHGSTTLQLRKHDRRKSILQHEVGALERNRKRDTQSDSQRERNIEMAKGEKDMTLLKRKLGAAT